MLKEVSDLSEMGSENLVVPHRGFALNLCQLKKITIDLESLQCRENDLKIQEAYPLLKGL